MEMEQDRMVTDREPDVVWGRVSRLMDLRLVGDRMLSTMRGPRT